MQKARTTLAWRLEADSELSESDLRKIADAILEGKLTGLVEQHERLSHNELRARIRLAIDLMEQERDEVL